MAEHKEKEAQESRTEEFKILDKKIEILQKTGLFISLVTGIALLSLITGIIKIGKQ